MEIAKNSNLSACLFHLQQKLLEGIMLDQDYVPVRGTWNVTKSNIDFDLDEHMDKFMVGEQKVLLLLGDSGAGKSLFCQQLQQRLLQNYLNDSTKHPLPLFIPLPSSKDPIHQVIETALLGLGCSAEEIELLKQSQQFIFIFDDYDEIRQNKNLYVTNHLKDWQAKVIITCRSQYLITLDYHAPYFMPYEGQKPQGWLLSEVVVKPFNQHQIDAYLQQYVKHHTTEWQDWKKYQQAIEEMPGLKALIQTPFLLKLAVEAMPSIVTLYEKQSDQIQYKYLTQAKLYDAFVEQWFTRQEEKLKANGQLKADETIKPQLWAYAQNLAKAMHQAQVTQITYEGDQDLFAENGSENSWEQFFAEDNETQLIRNASLLKKVGEHQYAFFHASLIDYFVSTEIHYQAQLISDTNQQIDNANLEQTDTPKEKNPQDNQQQKNINEIKVCDEQESSKFQNYFTNTNLPSHYYYFNQHILTKERGMLQFFADRVQEDVSFKQDLFKIIEGSKYDEAMCIAAANAITVLNKANVSFGMQDFAGIRIPQADLSYSNCDHTDFKGADLTGVNFTQAWLRKANLSYTQMAEVEFGQLPAIQHEHRVTAIAYNPNGKSMVTVDKNKLIVWGSETQKKLQELYIGEDCIYSVAFSPNGEMIAAGGKGKEVVVWDLITQKVRRLAHDDTIIAVVFCPDSSTVLAGSEKGELFLWHLKSEQIEIVARYRQAINAIAYSRNGVYIAAGCKDGQIHLHNQTLNAHQKFKGNSSLKITCLAFSPDCQWMASVAEYSKVKLWNLYNYKWHNYKLHPTSNIIHTIVFSPDNTYLASAGTSEHICLFNLKTQQVQLLIEHEKKINTLAFSPDGKFLAAGGDDKNVCSWRIADNLSFLSPRQNQNIRALCFSKTGDLLASASDDKTIHIHTLSTGHIQLLKVTGKAKSIAFSPDGKYLFAAVDTKLFKWELSTKLSTIINEHNTHYLESLAISPNGQYIAFGSNFLRLLELASSQIETLAYDYEEEASIDEINNKNFANNIIEAIYAINFSPNGNQIAAGSRGGIIRLWDLEINASKIPKLLKGHTSIVRALEYSPNGQWLASIADDDTVRLWNLTNKRSQVIDWKNQLGKLNFASDSKYLITSSYDGSVAIFETSTSKCFGKIENLQKTITDIKFVPYSEYHIVIGNITGNIKYCRLLHNHIERFIDNEITQIEKVTSLTVKHAHESIMTTLDWQLLSSTHSMMFEVADIKQINILGLSKNNKKLLKISKTPYDWMQDISHLFNLAREAVLSGRYQAAIDDITKYVQQGYVSGDFYWYRGGAKHGLGRFEEALEDYNQAIKTGSQPLNIYQHIGTAKMALGRFMEAIDDFNKMLKSYAEYAAAYNNRAVCKEKLGRYEEAIQDYNKAIELKPENASYLDNRGQCFKILNRYEEAIQDFTTAIEFTFTPSKKSLLFFRRAVTNNQLKNYEEAIFDFDQSIALALKKDPVNYINRSLSKIKLRRYSEANKDLDYAIFLDSKNATAYQYRGWSKYKLGDHQNAIYEYDQAIKLNSKNEIFYNNRGLSKHYLGFYDGALEDYNYAIQLNSNYAAAFYNRGVSQDNLGYYEFALNDYNQAILLDPLYAYYFSKRALINLGLCNFYEAITDSQQALTLAINKSDKIIQGHFAVVWAYQGKAENARQHLAKIISNLNEIYVESYLYGWVELLLDNYQEAIDHFSKVLAEKINDLYYMAASLMLRGKAYLALGNIEQARIDMEAALKEIPNHQGWQRWYQEVFGKQTISNIKNSANEKISNHIENNQVNEKLTSSDEKLSEIVKLGPYELIASSNDIINNLKNENLESNINETLQKSNLNDLPIKPSKINTIISNLSEAATYKKTGNLPSDINVEDNTQHAIKNAFQFWQKRDENNNDSKPVETLTKNIFSSSNRFCP